MRFLTLSLAFATAALAAPSVPSPRARGAASGLLSIAAGKSFKTATITDAALGSRDVTYWVTDTGETVLPGGIAIGKEADLLTAPPAQAHDLLWGIGEKHWPNATVYYRYASDEDERKAKPLFEQAQKRWRDATDDRFPGGYVQWPRFGNADKEEMNVTKITGSDGCWVTNGWDKTGMIKPRLNLAPDCSLTDAVAMLGILQGLQPEHQRPDRENTVHFACENLDPHCGNMPAGKNCCDSGLPKECCTMKSAFDVQHPGSYFVAAYDTGSVTHWPDNAFALPGKKTFIPVIPNLTIPPRPTSPSNGDIFGICVLNPYECEHGPHYNPPCPNGKRDVACGS